MVLTADQWSAAIVGAAIFFTAIGNYILQARAAKAKAGAEQAKPYVDAFAMEFGNRELIEQVTRIADSMAVLADKRTDEMEDMHRALLERLDMQERREEQEEQVPRRAPRRPR